MFGLLGPLRGFQANNAGPDGRESTTIALGKPGPFGPACGRQGIVMPEKNFLAKGTETLPF